MYTCICICITNFYITFLLSRDNDAQSTSISKNNVQSADTPENQPVKENGDTNICGNDSHDSEETDVDVHDFEQKTLFESIKAKSVGKFFLDIALLKTPPSDFKVRERHEDFVEKIASTMIEKRDISIDNAANVIAFIKVNKSVFKEEMLENCPIYLIDGNHNINAQKIAFEKTKDWIFKFRMVHIYCNLTPEEGLVLGTSRNEDSSTVLKFSDFEKVSLIRRYLYSSAQKKLSEEPPEPQKGFTTIYKQLLNLTTVSAYCLARVKLDIHRQIKLI